MLGAVSDTVREESNKYPRDNIFEAMQLLAFDWKFNFFMFLVKSF